MLCKDSSLESLFSRNIPVDESGILMKTELPTSTLDMTDDLFKTIESCFTPTAFTAIQQSGIA